MSSLIRVQRMGDRFILRGHGGAYDIGCQSFRDFLERDVSKEGLYTSYVFPYDPEKMHNMYLAFLGELQQGRSTQFFMFRVTVYFLDEEMNDEDAVIPQAMVLVPFSANEVAKMFGQICQGIIRGGVKFAFRGTSLTGTYVRMPR